MASYLLPNTESLLCSDPLGFCTTSDQDPGVQKFTVLKAILRVHDECSKSASKEAWAKKFCSMIEDIAYSLHGAQVDTGGLAEFIATSDDTISRLNGFQNHLILAALCIEDCFPDGRLTTLSQEVTGIRLSSEQVDCLLAHLFLGSLEIPTGNTWGRPGFTELFAARVASYQTAKWYTQHLIEHFAEGGYETTWPPELRDTGFFFHLSTVTEPERHRVNAELLDSQVATPRLSIRVVQEASEPGHHPFTLIAANSQPGPGPAGTQEERLVGQSPALAIASLLCSVLDPAAAIVTSIFPVHARWAGHGRAARVQEYYVPAERPLRAYVIADALELDTESREESCSVDLANGNPEREVLKLYAAFKDLRVLHSRFPQAERSSLSIELPPWGCGAFGGNLNIKSRCMIIAAALAGLSEEEMELVVTEDRAKEVTLGDVTGATVSSVFNTLVAHSR